MKFEFHQHGRESGDTFRGARGPGRIKTAREGEVELNFRPVRPICCGANGCCRKAGAVYDPDRRRRNRWVWRWLCHDCALKEGYCPQCGERQLDAVRAILLHDLMCRVCLRRFEETAATAARINRLVAEGGNDGG